MRIAFRMDLGISDLPRPIPAVFLLLILSLCALPLVALSPAEQVWRSIGPDGGDARSFASVPGQPEHLYLGSTNTWIYESLDGGETWNRLSKIAADDDLVLDNIVVDSEHPTTLFVAAWKAGRDDGGLFVSHDAGHSWAAIPQLRGQSVLSLAQSKSDPRIFVAGSLQGVFRSQDEGGNWERISPEGSRDLREVESLAIDPRNPNVIYAGTWHLPWKTTDGGKSWHSIKQGVIDDSDVFSIIIDAQSPRIVFASACSGIYKSEDGGELFHKVQGIPGTARRTRVLTQDPVHREVVYAGTTEGLYRTRDGGRAWQRMTGPETVVNDVFVDPANPRHVLLATDRGGVLASQDAAESFTPANHGFSARKVTALLVDRSNPSRMLAGVVNDKANGGAFLSTDAGSTWAQISEGLDGRDVFALDQAQDGTILAGTNQGIFALSEDHATGASWQPRNSIRNPILRTIAPTHYGHHPHPQFNAPPPAVELDGRVYALDLSEDVWFAATARGLFTSRDQGATWQGGPVLGRAEFDSVAAGKGKLMAARSDGLVLSTNGGFAWSEFPVPPSIKDIRRIAFSSDGQLWVGALNGVYIFDSRHSRWLWMEKLPLRDVGDLYFDRGSGRILASSRSSQVAFAIDPTNLTWKAAQTGYHLYLTRFAGDRWVAASLQDGVLIDPEPQSPSMSQSQSKSKTNPSAVLTGQR